MAIVRGLDAPGLPDTPRAAATSTVGRTAARQLPAAGEQPDPLRDGGRALIRPAQEDLFRLGTDLAIDLGRRDALAPVPEGHAELHASVRTTLHNYQPPDRAQSALREAFLGLLAARPDATSRSCVPGHITASAVVLSADRRHVLLTLHPRVGRWVQLGGHCEAGDGSIAAAALREATEESGIDGLTIIGGPVHLDVHPITCSLGVPTRHFDVRFACVAPQGARPVISSESRDLRWWPVDGLPEETITDLGARGRVGAASDGRVHDRRHRAPRRTAHRATPRTNWSGTYTYRAASVERPESVAGPRPRSSARRAGSARSAPGTRSTTSRTSTASRSMSPH